MEPQITSVSAYLSMLDLIVKEAFPRVVIEGEVSEWKVWNNQRVYFKLKDDKGAMDCVMWTLPRVQIESGMSVRITGKPGVYAARGSLSFSVSAIEPAGEGAIRRAYELLKAKLMAEGLFEVGRKRPLPDYPTRIGLITAAGSAAYADFMKMINARWVGLDISFVPVQVQGAGSPDQIVAALQTLNEAALPVDVIALVRGGGSLEDLQAFNAEQVVRAVATSRIPVMSGVGHEVDTSLTDLVADVRAATPTDAANRLVPDKIEVMRRLSQLADRQTYLTTRLIEEQKRLVMTREQRLDSYVRLAVQRIEQYIQRYESVVARMLDGARSAVREAEQRLQRYPVLAERALAAAQQKILRNEAQLHRTVGQRLTAAQATITHLNEKLELLNPKAILGRGYAIARVGDLVIKDGTGLKPGQVMMIELAQDVIDTTVNEVHRGKSGR